MGLWSEIGRLAGPTENGNAYYNDFVLSEKRQLLETVFVTELDVKRIVSCRIYKKAQDIKTKISHL